MNASSWQAVWLLAVEVAAVVVLTLLIAWRLRSVVWQRTLWQAGLIALIGLLVVEFSSFSFRKVSQMATPVTEAAVETMGEDLTLQLTVPPMEVTSEPVADYQPAPTTAFALTEIVPEPVPAMTVIEESSFEETPNQTFPFALAIVLGVWVVGSVVLAMRLLVGRFLLLRFCARSQTVFDVGLFDRVQGIARKLGMKQPVRVLETAHIQTPVVFGLFRLTIALPAGFTERFERRQQEAILAHELAHLAARDPLWYLLADALVSVLWWHPLVWVARARLQVASELAADEACVLAKHGPETLAECLVSIAKEMHGPGAMESIGIEGSGFRSRLGQRVERLLTLSAELGQRPAVWRTRLVKVGMPVVLVAVLLVTSGWARKEGALSWSDLQVQSWMVLSGLMEKPEISPPVKRERMLLAAATTAARPEESIPPSKPDAVKLPRIVFDKMPLSEVVSMLGKGARELGQTVEFRLEGSIPVSSGAVELGLLEITAEIKEGSSLREALNFVRIGAGFPLLLSEADGKIVLRAKETALKLPRPYVSKDGITSSLERAALIRWLNSVTLPKVSYHNEPLGRVSANLQEQVNEINRKAGGTERLRFFFERDSVESGVANLSITVDPPLVNKTALEVLMAVAEATPRESGKGARFTVDNHAQARWEWNVTEPPQLYSMGFGIDVPAFITGLEQSAGKKINVPADLTAEGRNLAEWISDSKELQDAMREFFAKKGAVFGAYTTNQAAKRIFLIGKTSILFVRASMTELDVIHTEIEGLKAQRVLPKVDEAKEKEASSLVQDAKQLYELRRLEEAEVKLREAIKIDPANTNAFHYLNLIQEARYGDLVRKRDIEQRSRIVVPGQIPKAGPLPVPNPYVRTNVSQTTIKSRQRLEAKLDNIVIKEVFFDGLPLSEVVRFLREESAKLDPEKAGVNFIINSHLDDRSGNQALQDPLGVPLQDLSVVLVNINPPLKNLTMREMLNAITNVTADVGKHGLAYAVEDYAVVFRQRVIEPPQMFTRILKIDTETFVKGLEKQMGMAVDQVELTPDETPKASATDQATEGGANLRTFKVQKLARAFFAKEGVDIRPTMTTNAPTTQIFFNDRTGVLMVRASLNDLSIIGNAVERMNTARQPELAGQEKEELHTRVIQIEPAVAIYWLQDKRLMGKDVSAPALQTGLVRYLSRELTMPVNASSGKWPAVVLDMEQKRLTARGNLKELQMIESAVQVLGLIPAQVQVEARYIEVSDKAAKEMGLTWFTSGPLNGTNTVKLDQLSNPTIPTNHNVRVEAPVLPNYVSVLSLAQAQALVKRFESQDGSDVLSAPKVTTQSNRQARIEVSNKLNIVVKKQINTGAGPKGDDQTVFQTSSVSTGPTLEVLPKVAADGLSMQLDWMVCITEFVGYDNPPKGVEKNEPLPRFRVRQVANTSMLRDGQTLLVGCGTSEVKKEKKGFFRSGSEVEKRHVIVMLTPRIIDPAGNQVNTDKDLGY